MNTQELAKKIAIEHKMHKSDKYDLSLREYDNMVEILGWIKDPTQNIKDFEGREMLFPKRWITIGIISSDIEISDSI